MPSGATFGLHARLQAADKKDGRIDPGPRLPALTRDTPLNRTRPSKQVLLLIASLLFALPGGAASAQVARDDDPNVDVRTTRRPLDAKQVKLAFKEAPIDEKMFAFIAEATGKVVMPVNITVVKNKKITLINDEYIDQSEALDLLFRAFRLNDIGVIEKKDVVIIGTIEQIVTVREMPILTADDDISHRLDRGSLVVKIFRLNEVRAADVGERLEGAVPSFANLTIDENSNQIVVMGTIGESQHLGRLITELDHRFVEPQTATFRLAYADATEISENILDLFETDSSGTGRTTARTARTARARTARPQAPQTAGTPVGPEIEMRVTVNIQQNSLTLFAIPSVIEQVAKLIDEEWDLPRSPGTSKIYTLVYTDPLKVAEKLNSLLGGGSGSGSGRTTGGAARAGGGAAGVEQILSGIYSIEAYPDTSQLLVFCKTEQSLTFLDQVIASLDQPSTIGLPFVSELKHANAIELAEELNALLSEAGAGATIERPGEGLSGRPEGDTGGGTTGTTSTAGEAGTMNFPWQRGGRQRDDQSPESSLIGKVRIVPIVRQNALAVLCPAPQRDAVERLIQFFDRPGRQVMISAIIAEVELTDDLALGIRFSNSDDILGGANPDFRLGSSLDTTAQRNPAFTNPDFFGDFFTTSVLDAAIPIRVAIQALQQHTNVRIIQEPVIFTADNQEALFFDGQDIPFITNTVINSQGNPNDSFEYREVGVTLNVRPRITVQRDVDLEILLELSSIVPGQTLFGGAIVDRRETRTHVVVNNGQTIVLSGILRDTESRITRKIPLLGDLPFVGELFKSRENTVATTELIAFITPHVVDNPSENDTNFQVDYRDRLDEIVRPVDEIMQDRLDNPEYYRERLLPPRREPPTSYGPEEFVPGDPVGERLLEPVPQQPAPAGDGG